MTTPSNVGVDVSRGHTPGGADHDAIGDLIELAGEQFGNGDFGRAATLLRDAARRCDPTSCEWQPIATAPKDGTAIILAASHGVSVGWWEDHEPRFKWRFVDDFDLTPTGCCDMESDDRVPCNGMGADAPSHWMPLPTPPAGETK